MSDTDAIDKKKSKESETDTTEYLSKLKEFIRSFVIVFLVVLIYFSCSGITLLLCKVAQSNILPTEPNCYPYAKQDANLNAIQMNIFTTGMFTDPELSMKLQIPQEKANMRFRILEVLRDYKETPSSNFLANYFIAIFEPLIQFNYSTINTFMNLMNGFPETLVVLFGPFINGILFGIGVFLNFFYFIYLYFSKMGWFFKENFNANNPDKPPHWVDVDLFSPIDYGIGVALVILFAIIFLIGLPILAFVPFLIVCYCMISSLFYKCKLNGKDMSLFGIITGVILHYKLSIVTILSIVIVSLAFSLLGNTEGLIAIFIICCIYYRLIYLDTFTPLTETNLTPMVSNEQANKTCKKIRITGLQDMWFGGGGKGFSKRLKKIGEKLKTGTN